jgi:signal transduction histidine kinase
LKGKIPYSDQVRLKFIMMYNIIGLISTASLVIFFLITGKSDFEILFFASLGVMPLFILSIYLAIKKEVYATSVFSMISSFAGIASSVNLELSEFLSLIIIFILSSIFIAYRRWQAVLLSTVIVGFTIIKVLSEMKSIDAFSDAMARDGSIFIVAVFLFSIFSYALVIGINVNRGLLDSDRLLDLTDELKASIAAKDKLYSIISHDLKSPISSMAKLSKAMLDNKMKASNDAIQMLADTSQNVDDLLKNLLSWSQLQNSVHEVQSESFSINESIDESIQLLKSTSNLKSINIVNECADEHVVLADRSMVFAVMRNLLSNAIKYSHEKSEIRIICVRLDSHIKISVKDNGIGMSEEIKAKLFSKSELNASLPGTKNEKGTGMGLLLASEFVRLNKGEIGVESQIEKGSTFWFTLPLDSP